jgi:cell wall-associated NlpC family hydrolase
MSAKALGALAAGVLILLLACSGLATVLLGGGGMGLAGCTAPAASGGSAAALGSGQTPSAVTTPADRLQVAGWDTGQVANAATIVTVGNQLGIPPRGWVIAVATAMQESQLTNLPYLGDGNDNDSVGLFQQRPSQGWGSPDKLLDPVYAATTFFQALLRVDGWQSMPLTQAAQQVQKSAHPDAFAKWEDDATTLVSAVGSALGLAVPDDLEQCVNTCPSMTASPNGPVRSCADVSAVFARAQSWLTAWPGGGPVPYSMSGAPDELFGGYRRDCSGYVSMALGLSRPGLDTIQLAAQSTPISKADLQPGDLMIKPAAGGAGHVVLFERWADASMTSYWGYEQSGDGGTHYRQIPYPYFSGYSMSPYRLGN